MSKNNLYALNMVLLIQKHSAFELPNKEK